MTAAEVHEQESVAATQEAPDEDAGQGKPVDAAPAEFEWDGAEEFRHLRKTFNVQNNIYGGVRAEHGVFGVGFGESLSSAASGPLDVERVAETLRCFVSPPERSTALVLLRQHSFVVLVGPESSGKRALALHLLREVCGPDAPLEAASPARGLGQLGGIEFVEGTGYLVADHLGTNEEPAVRSYEADRLATACSRRGAHLVLTTTSRRMSERHLTPYAITVGPPDPVQTLHSHLGDVTIEPDVIAMGEEHVRAGGRPRGVALLARRMIDDSADAVAAMRDVPKEQVATWFDGRITMRDLLSITALAVGGSQPEPTHDHLIDLLRVHAVATQEKRAAAPHLPWHEEVLEQRSRSHPLVAVVAADDLDDDGWLAGKLVRFRHGDHRAHVLRELYDRYGHQLWHPVRNWVHDLCRSDSPVDVLGELAYALALLARENFVEIRDGYLTGWAAGLAAERTTAAMVLWFMSYDDRLAPVALRTALDWGQNNGLNRAVTSALALGGPLGIRFSDEALQRLCFLALRARRIGEVARTAISVLFAVAVAEDSVATGRVLATVRTELIRAVDPHHAAPADLTTDSYVVEQLAETAVEQVENQEQYERGWTGRVAKAARSMALALLRAEEGEGSGLVTARILRDAAGAR